MPLQFSNIRTDVLSGGIDSRSAENQIDEGFLRDALNTETVQKHVRKRKGYVGHATSPIRIHQAESNTTEEEICFILDESINLLNVRSSPLVISGQLSQGSGPMGIGTFSETNSTKYYSRWYQKIRKQFSEGIGNTLSIPTAESSLDSANVFIGIAESTNSSTLSNRTIDFDSLEINESTYNLDINYSNSTGSSIPVFVYYADKSTSVGSNYVHPSVLVTNGTVGAAISISANTHNLSNFNIIARVYQTTDPSSGIRQLVDPDALDINTVTGTVTVTLTNVSGADLRYIIILSAAPASNFKQGLLDGTTYTITLNDVGGPFIFPGVYVSTGATTLSQVIPNNIEYDSSTNSIAITFDVPPSFPDTFQVYWEYGTIKSNTICVTDSDVTTDITDFRPQLTIWGLEHSELYSNDAGTRAGWVNHIDTFRVPGESRIVSGSGGNLFSARTYAEDGNTYKYASLFSSLFGRLGVNHILAPVFWETGETPGRTRGYITGTGLSDNWTTVTNVEWDASVAGGTVRYDMTIPALFLSGSLSTIISTDTGLEDWLTVESMSYTRHNGTFRIKQVTQPDATTLSVWVENSTDNVGISEWDDSGVSGRAAIFTDRISLSDTSPFIPGDIIQSDGLPEGTLISCLGTSDTVTDSVVVDGIVEILNLGVGLQITGARTGSVIPLRDLNDNPSTTNVVRGDILEYDGISREFRVIHVNTLDDTSISNIDGDGSTAIATIADTDQLSIGMAILIRNAGEYTGEHIISEIPDGSTFKFSHTSTATGITSGVLIGHTIHISESIEWQDTPQDDQVWITARRLIPIEAPEDNYPLTRSTYIKTFSSNDETSQPFIRSTMASDTMYLTNYDDPVYKFDGTNIYRAGLPNWQPGCFLIQDATSTAKVVNNLRSVNYDNGTSVYPSTPPIGSIRTATADENQLSILPVGTAILLPGDTDSYTITSVGTNKTTTEYYYFLDRALSSSVAALGTATEVAVYRYYYRLNLIDANQNRVASAIAQSEDYVIQLRTDAAIKHKLVGFPPFDNYDYDRIYLETYRTKKNTSGPFYLVSQQQIRYLGGDGYIEFTDTFSDFNLFDLDKTSTLTGGELGIGWQGPPRAKYITNAANTVVYGNIKDYPELDIQLFSSSLLSPTQVIADVAPRLEFNRTDTPTNNPSDKMHYEVAANSNEITAITAVLGTSFTVTTSLNHGLVVGDWVYIHHLLPLIPISFIASATTVDVGTDTITAPAHGLINNTIVRFSGSSLPAPLVAGTNYYVISTTTDTFKVSATLGGPAINITTTGSDNVQISIPRDLTYCGWFQVFSQNGTNKFTVKYTNSGSGTVSLLPNQVVKASANGSYRVPIWMGTDGNFGQYDGNSTNGLSRLTKRVALAINATMSMVDRSISGQLGFRPWLLARGGNDTGISGRMIIKQPSVSADVISFNLTKSDPLAIMKTFVNDTEIDGSSYTTATSLVFPSRILLGYPNYPEIFDSPTETLDTESDSAIDINPADGQEITGIVPFFGESAFGGSQQSQVIVVFKEQSIYLVDANEKRSGNPAVQRIETEGIGCTAPNSISVTKNGIIFANESGVYVLRRNMSVDYIGKYMERNWTERVDRDQLELVQGHHYTSGRQYKISVPIIGNNSNSEVFVYDHSNESQEGLGSWTRYDNHPATGWCNLSSDSFFGSTLGRVYRIRNDRDKYDYQDDNQAINMVLQLRPNDFGIMGARKVIDCIIVNYRTAVPSNSTQVAFAMDTDTEYQISTPVIINNRSNLSGLGDTIPRDVITVRHNTNRRRGVYCSVQISNNALYESTEVAGIEYRVASLGSPRGILQAAKTS